MGSFFIYPSCKNSSKWLVNLNTINTIVLLFIFSYQPVSFWNSNWFRFPQPPTMRCWISYSLSLHNFDTPFEIKIVKHDFKKLYIFKLISKLLLSQLNWASKFRYKFYMTVTLNCSFYFSLKLSSRNICLFNYY